MRSTAIVFVICMALAMSTMTQAEHNAHCKELNQVNCYMGQNEGYFCSKNEHAATQTRWFFDKGVCRKFNYKGCYGNRNRFCTKEACERRCRG
ncbi:actinia tenebrosa protease inhibitors [Anastrepha obliqua]|uniref:actinia tenebrosa protease inhibitors n=1 Tax=Anastrepha obliqua TaxID=95512 RepID=UPI00240A2A9A|nr:actinia tenebrosa protease inhibitors [Anastrepha obliqua]